MLKDLVIEDCSTLLKKYKINKGSLSSNYKIYLKAFRTFDEFLKSILDENCNPIFYKMASMCDDYDFTSTNSYKEAWDMARYSWNEGFDKFYNKFKCINYKLEETKKREHYFLPVGYSPSVPRYLKGIPTTMHAYQDVYENKNISIFMNLSYSASEKKGSIENRGILTLNLIDYLEKKNYNVNFYTLEASYESGEICMYIIPLKKFNEKLNVKKCYFPLVNPSFLRRLVFRLNELTPVENYGWGSSYGTPLLLDKKPEFIELAYNLTNPRDKFNSDYIYISTPEELGINGKDINEDCENFIKIINSKYHLFDDEKAKKKTKRKGEYYYE